MKKQHLIATLILALALSACGGAAVPTTSTPAAIVATATSPAVNTTVPASPPATLTPVAGAAQPTQTVVTPAKDMPASGATSDPAKLQQANLVIVYDLSGGIAGRHDTYRLYADGSLVSTLNGITTTRSVSGTFDVSAMLARIVNAGFFDLGDSYLPANKCCDLMTYKLTIMHGGIAKTVTTMDGIQKPAALAQAIQEVNSLLK